MNECLWQLFQPRVTHNLKKPGMPSSSWAVGAGRPRGSLPLSGIRWHQPRVLRPLSLGVHAWQWPGKAGERPARGYASNVWPKPLDAMETSWDRGPSRESSSWDLGSSTARACLHPHSPSDIHGPSACGQVIYPPQACVPSCKMRMIISNSESVDFYKMYKIQNTGPDIKRVFSKWELLLFLGRVEVPEFWWWARETWLCYNIRTGPSPDRSALGPVSTQPANSYILK